MAGWKLKAAVSEGLEAIWSERLFLIRRSHDRLTTVLVLLGARVDFIVPLVRTVSREGP